MDGWGDLFGGRRYTICLAMSSFEFVGWLVGWFGACRMDGLIDSQKVASKIGRQHRSVSSLFLTFDKRTKYCRGNAFLKRSWHDI